MSVSPIKNTTFQTIVCITMLIATLRCIVMVLQLHHDIWAKIEAKSGLVYCNTRIAVIVATISQYIRLRHQMIRNVDYDVCYNVTKHRNKFDVTTNVAICRDLKQINIIII